MSWPRSKCRPIARLQREVGAGRCPFCERPLTRKAKGRPPVVCFRADCQCAYYAEHKREWRRVMAALRGAAAAIRRANKRMGAT